MGDKPHGATQTSHDHLIARLSDRQHGNITRAQLLNIGLSRQTIDRRVRTGRLFLQHAGVYSVGRPAKTALERAAAAVLACGEHALLSHFAALALWELGDWPRRFDVTVIRGADRRPKGVRVHRSTTVLPRDTRTHHGIRVTSPARTLLDCAPLLAPRRRTRAVNDALHTKHLKRHHLAELLDRTTIHPGKKLLLPFTETSDGPTRSPFEDDFPLFCATFGLPLPRVNIKLDGREVDAYFEAENLIVELDGYEFHSDRDAFETDRDKDAEALLNGRATVRITRRRLRDAPEREAERLHKILAARRAA